MLVSNPILQGALKKRDNDISIFLMLVFQEFRPRGWRGSQVSFKYSIRFF